MKKKILSILISIVIVVASMPICMNASSAEVDNQPSLAEYVENNYTYAGVYSTLKEIKFNGMNVTNISYASQSYSFFSNLLYCSTSVATAPSQIINNVNSWISTPRNVVMLYDGVRTASFPVKIGYGGYEVSSTYSGSYLHSVFLIREEANDTGTISNVFNLANGEWIGANRPPQYIPRDDWVPSASYINSWIPSSPVSNGYGINLSNQNSALINRVALDNNKYITNPVAEPIAGKRLTFMYRYANPTYDLSSHYASPDAHQYVINIVPYLEIIEEMKEQYPATIGTFGLDAYTDKSETNYLKAIKAIIDFKLNDYFTDITDNEVIEKVSNCRQDIESLVTNYRKAYNELARKYLITFKAFDGTILSENYYEADAIPTAPENTKMHKTSSVGKYHYRYYWPTITKVTSKFTYTERRSSVQCTEGEGVITRPATCAMEGITEYTCSVCGDTRTEAIETLPHEIGEYKACYEDGAIYSTELQHDALCSSYGEVIKTENCDFEIVENNRDSIKYQCTVCNGIAIYSKTGHTITFQDLNGDTISQEVFYEDEAVTPPNSIPSAYFDDNGHHSFRWNKNIESPATKDATYKISETVFPHSYANYEYNGDANRHDLNGTETGKCVMIGCTYTKTRACSEQHYFGPTATTIVGKITLATDNKGTASSHGINGASVTIDSTDATVYTDENGEFSIANLADGEYTITIDSATAITRKVSINIDFDNADNGVMTLEPIGLVVCDYNKDGIINTIDAAMFADSEEYRDLNGDGTIDDADSKLFKLFFRKPIQYSK